MHFDNACQRIDKPNDQHRFKVLFIPNVGTKYTDETFQHTVHALKKALQATGKFNFSIDYMTRGPKELIDDSVIHLLANIVNKYNLVFVSSDGASLIARVLKSRPYTSFKPPIIFESSPIVSYHGNVSSMLFDAGTLTMNDIDMINKLTDKKMFIVSANDEIVDKRILVNVFKHENVCIVKSGGHLKCMPEIDNTIPHGHETFDAIVEFLIKINSKL